MRWAIVSGVTIALLLLCAVAWRRLHEPKYAGQPMRYWLQRALTGNQSQETKEAIVAIGPEAIRVVAEEMKSADSAWHERWVQWYDRMPNFGKRLVLRPVPAKERRFTAFSFLNAISDAIKGPRMQSLLPMFIANVTNDDQRPCDGIVDAETHVALSNGTLVRMISAYIVGNFGPEAASAVPVLISALHDRDKWKHYRNELIGALGRIGAPAKDALPALLQETVDPVFGVGAAQAAWRIDPTKKDLVTTFLETAGLQLTNDFARTKAARLHWQINSNANTVLPVLLEIIRDPANSSAGLAMFTLGEMGGAAQAALPVLSNKLSDKDESVQKAAQAAIRKISAEPKWQNGSR
jgi:hypothetical protein